MLTWKMCHLLTPFLVVLRNVLIVNISSLSHLTESVVMTKVRLLIEDQEEAKAGTTLTPEQTEDKETSNSTSSTSPKTSEMATSDPQLQNVASDGSVPNTSEVLQFKSETTRYAGKDKGVDSKDMFPEKATSKKSPVTSSEMGGGKTDIPLTTSQPKQDGEVPVVSPSTARPPFQENIVLGVALEGSKRTLPIEEDMAPSPIESKEFTASRNGSGGSLGTDVKD